MAQLIGGLFVDKPEPVVDEHPDLVLLPLRHRRLLAHVHSEVDPFEVLSGRNSGCVGSRRYLRLIQH